MRTRVYFVLGALLLPFVLLGASAWLRITFLAPGMHHEIDLIVGVAGLAAGCSCAIRCVAPSKSTSEDYVGFGILAFFYLMIYVPLLFFFYFFFVLSFDNFR